MYIKEITIQKSRTIEVAGMMGRTKYMKVSIGMTAEYSDEDYNLNVEGEVRELKNQLSKLVDEAMLDEVKKLNKK